MGGSSAANMFLNSVKFCYNRTNRELVNQKLFRHISKTSSTSNSEIVNISQDKRDTAKNRHNKQKDVTKWMFNRKYITHRALSTLNAHVIPKSINMASKDESREFMSLFPDLVSDLTEAIRRSDIPEVPKRFAKVLQYNVPTGKKIRGLGLVAAYKIIESPENLTPENIRLANILGWCVEMLQSFLLICDDVMDQSETRRGTPCWYKNKDVGFQAINDGIMIENGIYVILKKYFSDHPSYAKMLELFHDVTLKTTMGQSLDIMCMTDDKPNLDSFTMHRYDAIVKYKTAYYSFYLPVALAMNLSQKHDDELHRQAKTILLEMGHFFQIQDDFLDCFGNPEVTGKKGTDIFEGKCTWLAVVALQRASSAQKEILREHYGKPNDESEQIVRNLYEELGLPHTYAIYEEESFNLIRTHIQQISKGLPHALFFKFMEKLYRREC